MVFKIQKFFETMIPYKMLIQALCMALMVFVSIVQFISHKSMVLPAFMVGILSIVNFLFTKDLHKEKMEANEATKEKTFQYVLTMVVWICWAWEIADRFTMLASFRFMRTFSLMLLVLFIFVGVVLLCNKTCLKSVIEWNIYLNEKMPELSPGDVVVGDALNHDTKEPTGMKVVQYYKDRFVHTLVLGATGTGKTSQILGPMSYQDLKNPEMGVIVIDPKGDFAELDYARAKNLGRKAVTYFNPVLPDCPYFNPLMCTEEGEPEMIENIVTAFQSLDTTSSSYFRDMNEVLIRNSVKAVKRLKGNDATLNDVLILMNNINQQGEEMINELRALKDPDPFVMKDNDQIYSYFIRDYFPGLKGAKGASKTYSDSSAIRNQVQKLVSNPYLNRVLNPKKTSELKPGEYLDFDRVLEKGEVLCMCSAQGSLREMGRYLGYFLILTLQSSIFRRGGDENTRRGCALYIDEFQTYANDSMEDLLTQGRSYKVACIFATQNLSLINSGGDKGKRFQQTVISNMRNLVLFPGMSYDDAKYFSNAFGSRKQTVERKSTTTRAYVPKFVGFDSARESVSESEEDVPLFSVSDLIYQANVDPENPNKHIENFGRVTVRVIDHNSLQAPCFTKISFVDRAIDQASRHYIDELHADRTAREEKAAAISKKVEKEIDRQIKLDTEQRYTSNSNEDDMISLFEDEWDEPDVSFHPVDVQDDNDTHKKSDIHEVDTIENRVDQALEDDEEEIDIDKEF